MLSARIKLDSLKNYPFGYICAVSGIISDNKKPQDNNIKTVLYYAKYLILESESSNLAELETINKYKESLAITSMHQGVPGLGILSPQDGQGQTNILY